MAKVVPPINDTTKPGSIQNSKADFSTDIHIKKLILNCEGLGQVDLKPLLLELNYFEDIFNNCISGKIAITDGSGLIKDGGLNGTESIEMEFGSSSVAGKTIKHKARIFSITERHFDVSFNFENYVINFCSEELLLSEKYRVCKAYRVSTISDIITDIMKNTLKTKQPITDFDTTSGVYDFVIPNKKIFETINWLSTYAQVSSSTGADMLFYQNNEGYHFKSLQKLYTGKPKSKFYYVPKNVKLVGSNNSMTTDIYNIMRLEVINNFDTLNATTRGAFSNKLITIDPMTRTANSAVFNYNEYFTNAKSLNTNAVTENNNIDNYKDRFGNSMWTAPKSDLEVGALRMHVSNSGHLKQPFIQPIQQNNDKTVVNDFFVEKYLPYRVAQLSLLNYLKLKITISGNANVSVGDVIYVEVYSVAALSSKTQRQKDKYLSGNYLITAIRHIVSVSTYTCVLEISKESNIT